MAEVVCLIIQASCRGLARSQRDLCSGSAAECATLCAEGRGGPSRALQEPGSVVATDWRTQAEASVVEMRSAGAGMVPGRSCCGRGLATGSGRWSQAGGPGPEAGGICGAVWSRREAGGKDGEAAK